MSDAAHTHEITSTEVAFSIHLGETFGNGQSYRRFELRLGDHVVYRDSVWAGADEMANAISVAAQRLRDLMADGALIQYEED